MNDKCWVELKRALKIEDTQKPTVILNKAIQTLIAINNDKINFNRQNFSKIDLSIIYNSTLNAIKCYANEGNAACNELNKIKSTLYSSVKGKDKSGRQNNVDLHSHTDEISLLWGMLKCVLGMLDEKDVFKVLSKAINIINAPEKVSPPLLPEIHDETRKALLHFQARRDKVRSELALLKAKISELVNENARDVETAESWAFYSEEKQSSVSVVRTKQTGQSLYELPSPRLGAAASSPVLSSSEEGNTPPSGRFFSSPKVSSPSCLSEDEEPLGEIPPLNLGPSRKTLQSASALNSVSMLGAPRRPLGQKRHPFQLFAPPQMGLPPCHPGSPCAVIISSPPGSKF